MCSAHHSIMSTQIFTEGRGGQIHSFCAMNSFSMSAWTVPPSFSGGMPCRSATTTYIARSTIAGALIVIEVVTWSRGMPLKSISMSSMVEIATPSRPTSPRLMGWSAS
jgi:hypothetical protein